MPPKKRKNDERITKQVTKSRKRKDNSDEEEETDFANGTESGTESGEQRDITLDGSSVHGELLFCGGTNWDLLGRNSVPKGVKNKGGPNLWGPHRLSVLSGVTVCRVVSGSMACHCIALTPEGKVYVWGRNDKGQLGVGDTERRDLPQLLDSLSECHVIDAACGKNHTLLLTNKGDVYACGDNTMGQLGLGSQTQMIPTPSKIRLYSGSAVRRLSCGSEFSMILDIRGHLFSFGCPEYGQLGHNTDGKYFVASSKMSFSCELKPRRVQVFIEKSRDGHVTPVNDVYVEDVKCGANHAIIVDSKKRVFSWGFGGYGRLGHNEPRDEMVPRHIKFFDGTSRGAKSIAVGTTYSMAVNEIGALFLWGQTKTTGEAAMYPKPVMDLSGWEVRSIGTGNRSIVIAADDGLVSWGPSPTYGELGYGDNRAKSSTYAQEVKTLKDVYIHQVSCGYGMTLMIARQDSDEDRDNVNKLPLFTPST